MTEPRPDSSEDLKTPRWVKLSAIGGGVVVVLIIVLMLAGHGPGQHMHMGAATVESPK